MRLVTLALAAVWVLSTPAPAQAQAPRTIADALTVVAAEGACLDHASLRDRLERWLRRPDVTADLSFQVRVETEGHTSFSLYRSGELAAFRSFDVLPEACDSRRDAVSLALALAIDHTVLDHLRTADSPETPTIEPPTEAPEPPADPVTPPPRLRARAVASVGALIGAFPDPVGALRIGLELAHQRPAGPTLEVRASAQITSRSRVPLGRGVVRGWLPTGRVDGCIGGHTSTLTLGVCTGVAAGVLWATGEGFEFNRSTQLPWLAVTGTLWARYPREGRVALRLGVDVMGVAIVPELVITDREGEEIERRTLPRLGVMPVAEVVWTWR